MSQRVPEFTAKYKALINLTEDSELPTNYTEIFSFNETCTLEAMQFKFDTKDVDLKIVIDGFTTLEVNLSDLYYFESTQTQTPKRSGQLFFDINDHVFHFTPSNPIQVKSDIAVYAKATTFSWWGSNGKYKGHIVTLQNWS